MYLYVYIFICPPCNFSFLLLNFPFLLTIVHIGELLGLQELHKHRSARTVFCFPDKKRNGPLHALRVGLLCVGAVCTGEEAIAHCCIDNKECRGRVWCQFPKDRLSFCHIPVRNLWPPLPQSQRSPPYFLGRDSRPKSCVLFQMLSVSRRSRDPSSTLLRWYCPYGLWCSQMSGSRAVYVEALAPRFQNENTNPKNDPRNHCCVHINILWKPRVSCPLKAQLYLHPSFNLCLVAFSGTVLPLLTTFLSHMRMYIVWSNTSFRRGCWPSTLWTQNVLLCPEIVLAVTWQLLSPNRYRKCCCFYFVAPAHVLEHGQNPHLSQGLNLFLQRELEQ